MSYTSGTLNSADAFNALFDAYLLADGWTKTANSTTTTTSSIQNVVTTAPTITVPANSITNIPIGAKITYTGSGAAKIYLIVKDTTTSGKAISDIAHPGINNGTLTYTWNTYQKDGIYFVFAGVHAGFTVAKQLIVFDISTASTGASQRAGSLKETPFCHFVPSLAEMPCTYEIFKNTSPNEISVVFTFGNNQTEHFHLGVLQKIHSSAYTGGQYLTASGVRMALSGKSYFVSLSETQYVLGSTAVSSSGCFFSEIQGGAGATNISTLLICEVDTTTVKDMSSTPLTGGIAISQNAMRKFFRGLNQWNSQATLVPIELVYYAPSSFKSYLGYPLHLRLVRVDNYNNGDIITLGTDQWKVYSTGKKDLAARNSSSASTGTVGFAVRYTP